MKFLKAIEQGAGLGFAIGQLRRSATRAAKSRELGSNAGILIPIMHFNIEFDTGDRVTAWLVPDNPAEKPRLRVKLEPNVDVIVDANVQRDDLRAAGLHGSGLCGFDITPVSVPGLNKSSRIIISDPTSGLVLFQRARSQQHVDGRLFRLETRAVPRSHLDGLLQTNFQMNFVNLDRFSATTCYAVLSIPYSTSMYVTGRLPMPAVRDLLRSKGFTTSVLLGDPFRELFSRLVVLRGDSRQGLDHGASLVPPAVRMRIQRSLMNVTMSDISAVAKAVGGLDSEARHHLSDPMTRQLTLAEPGQPLDREAAQRALLQLASFDVVGLESDPGSFIETICASLNAQFSVNGTRGTTPDTSLNDALRAEPPFRSFLRYDSVVFDGVVQTVESLPEPDDEIDQPPPLITFAGSRTSREAQSR